MPFPVGCEVVPVRIEGRFDSLTLPESFEGTIRNRMTETGLARFFGPQ